VQVVVIGAGVAGLATALTLSRSGHSVTLLERDATPLPPDPAGAFEWDRRGAPQVRHSHAFLARLRNLLRDRYPDVLQALLDAGATDMDFIAMLPEGMDRTPHEGDEDLVALACRRTTFEWVLRTIALDNPAVTLIDGVAAASLMGRPSGGPGEPAVVTGVCLADGRELTADLVVLSGGRRSTMATLFDPLGIEIEEHEEDTGIVYLSRFFELNDDSAYPEQTGPIGGDLGYLKYGVFPGDNRTFSITLAVGSHDDEFRSGLLDPDGFLRAAAALPATAAHVDGRAFPVTGVNVMAKLLNRERRFLDKDGNPLVIGVSAVGDAHTCTNPLYGRGCSLAVVQADLLATSLSEHPDDPTARVVAYEQASREQIHPWYRASVAQDAATRAEAERARALAERDVAEPDEPSRAPEPPPTEDPMRAIMRDGLFPAMRVDPVVLRAFLRMFNLLEPPDSLMSNWDVLGRVMTVYQERDDRPPEPSLGPDRAQMLAALHAA